LVDKLWLKVLFVDLLREKNTAEWLIDLADKLKRTGRKNSIPLSSQVGNDYATDIMTFSKLLHCQNA
jgi:hypothetical protein